MHKARISYKVRQKLNDIEGWRRAATQKLRNELYNVVKLGINYYLEIGSIVNFEIVRR